MCARCLLLGSVDRLDKVGAARVRGDWRQEGGGSCVWWQVKLTGRCVPLHTN